MPTEDTEESSEGRIPMGTSGWVGAALERSLCFTPSEAWAMGTVTSQPRSALGQASQPRPWSFPELRRPRRQI